MKRTNELKILILSVFLVCVAVFSVFASGVWPFNKATNDKLKASDWNEAVRVTGMATAVGQKYSGDTITAGDWNALQDCIEQGQNTDGEGGTLKEDPTATTVSCNADGYEFHAEIRKTNSPEGFETRAYTIGKDTCNGNYVSGRYAECVKDNTFRVTASISPEIVAQGGRGPIYEYYLIVNGVIGLGREGCMAKLKIPNPIEWDGSKIYQDTEEALVSRESTDTTKGTQTNPWKVGDTTTLKITFDPATLANEQVDIYQYQIGKTNQQALVIGNTMVQLGATCSDGVCSSTGAWTQNNLCTRHGITGTEKIVDRIDLTRKPYPYVYSTDSWWVKCGEDITPTGDPTATKIECEADGYTFHAELKKVSGAAGFETRAYVTGEGVCDSNYINGAVSRYAECEKGNLFRGTAALSMEIAAQEGPAPIYEYYLRATGVVGLNKGCIKSIKVDNPFK